MNYGDSPLRMVGNAFETARTNAQNLPFRAPAHLLGHERDRLVADAKQEIPLVTSYDYRKLDAGLAVTTGNFTKELTRTWNSLIKVSAPQVKAVQTVSVTEAGIESLSANGKQAVVLVFGQGSVTSANTSTSGSPRLDLLSVRVTMDLVKGRWLIAELEQAG